MQLMWNIRSMSWICSSMKRLALVDAMTTNAPLYDRHEVPAVSRTAKDLQAPCVRAAPCPSHAFPDRRTLPHFPICESDQIFLSPQSGSGNTSMPK